MGGFLGSLMGSMEETHKSVAGTAAGELFARLLSVAINFGFYRLISDA